MNSFYGGKQGRTYHIVERYDDIFIDYKDFEPFVAQEYEAGAVFSHNYEVFKVLQAGPITAADLSDNSDKVIRLKGMVSEFQKGGAYTDVNYGEYVLIDTILNRNHKEDDINGLLYRRGFDYTESYVGIRPKKTNVETKEVSGVFDGVVITKSVQNLYVFHDYELIGNSSDPEVKDLGFNNEKWTSAWRKYVLKPGGGAIYVGQIVGPQGSSPELKGLSWEDYLIKAEEYSEVWPKGVVPLSETLGWQPPKEAGAEGVYNDVIQLGYCNIKDEDGQVEGCYISFDIPYHIITVTGQSVDPYGDESRSHYDPASGEIDSNIKITAEYDEQTGEYKYSNLIHKHSYTGADGSNQKHPFYSHYDIAIPKGIHGESIEEIKHESATEVNSKIKKEEDKINIDNVNVFSDDEYITYYLRDFNQSAAGAISQPLGRWPYRVIKTISTHFRDRVYKFNTLNDWVSTQVKLGDLVPVNKANKLYLICIKAGSTSSNIPDASVLTRGYEFTSGSTSSSSKWRVIEISQTAAAYELDVDYTAGKNETIPFNALDYLFMDDYGNLYARYTKDADRTPYFICKIFDIVDIKLVNNNQQDGYDLTKPQFFGIKRRGDSEFTAISKNLNLIEDIRLKGDNVIVLYSDPDYRASIQQEGQINKTYYEEEYTDRYGKTYPSLVWKNLTSTANQFHILGQVTLDDLKAGGRFHDGIKQAGYEDREGWILSVTNPQSKDVTLYAFDYLLPDDQSTWPDLPDDKGKSRWYQLQSFEQKYTKSAYTVRLSCVSETQNPDAYDAQYWQDDELNVNGLWFVISDGHSPH